MVLGSSPCINCTLYALSLNTPYFVTPSTHLLPRSDLASIPQASGTTAAQQEAQDAADATAATENADQMPIAVSAGEEIQDVAADQGFVVENRVIGASAPAPTPDV